MIKKNIRLSFFYLYVPVRWVHKVMWLTPRPILPTTIALAFSLLSKRNSQTLLFS